MPNPLLPFKMTEKDFHEYDDNQMGMCIKCGEMSDGDCEPDARRYPCGACKKNAVYGMQEMMLMGWIELTFEEELKPIVIEPQQLMR
jgi:hypothetical protein